MSTDRTQTPRTVAIDNAAAELTVWHSNHPLTINEFSIRDILARHFEPLELEAARLADALAALVAEQDCAVLLAGQRCARVRCATCDARALLKT